MRGAILLSHRAGAVEILFAAKVFAFHARDTRISTLMRCCRFLKWTV